MFNKVEFRKEATPKRIFAFLKLIAYKDGSLTKDEVVQYIQPQGLTKGQEEIERVINFSVEEGLVRLDQDKKYWLCIDKDNVENEIAFRKYINSILYDDIKNNVFFEASSEMISADINLYSFTGFSNIATYFRESKSIKEEVILGWRFWGAFLGFGFIMNSQFVVNPYGRIKDLLELNFNNEMDKLLKFKDFIIKLASISPDFKKSINGNELSIALSMALITLEELNIVSLEEVRDSEDKWIIKTDSTVRYVTHIKINGGELLG